MQNIYTLKGSAQTNSVGAAMNLMMSEGTAEKRVMAPKVQTWRSCQGPHSPIESMIWDRKKECCKKRN